LQPKEDLPHVSALSMKKTMDGNFALLMMLLLLNGFALFQLFLVFLALKRKKLSLKKLFTLFNL